MELQNRLYRKFLNRIPIAIPAKGFVLGENYQTFLMPHIGKKHFLRIDIKDFFGSFSEDDIRRGMSEYVVDKKALKMIVELCTLEKKLPQGAITSPVLSNILFKRVDQRIIKYCQKIEEAYITKGISLRECDWCICYTRYADDMLFSSDFFDFGENMYFYRMISNILKDYGFQINWKKTVFSNEQIALNGYVVGKNLHLSRSKMQNLKRILYVFRDENAEQYTLDKQKLKKFPDTLKKINQLDLMDKKGKRTFASLQELIQYLAGCRSWLISVLQIGDITQRQVRDTQKIVRRIEIILEELHKLEE